MVEKDSMNTDKLIGFMTRLITDSKKKVFLILGDLRGAITLWVLHSRFSSNHFALHPIIYIIYFLEQSSISLQGSIFFTEELPPHIGIYFIIWCNLFKHCSKFRIETIYLSLVILVV